MKPSIAIAIVNYYLAEANSDNLAVHVSWYNDMILAKLHVTTTMQAEVGEGDEAYNKEIEYMNTNVQAFKHNNISKLTYQTRSKAF